MNHENGHLKRPTLLDVAAVAGVSAQTVSRHLKGFEGIRPETRDRVEAAITELGYRPNLAARQLRTQKSYRLGAIAHEMFAYGPSMLLGGATAEARSAGYSLSVVGVDGEDRKSVDDAFRLFEEEQVAGILAVTLTDDVRAVVEQRRSDIPIIVDPAEDQTASLSASEFGAREAARHLVELGHRRVGLIDGPCTWVPARQRHDGFVQAIEEAGAECVWSADGDWTPSSGSRAATAFDPATGATAVFAANDAMAIGFMHGLVQRGLDIPGDVSIVGFDDVPEAEHLLVPLSTVRPQFAEDGRFAIRALLAQIDGRPVPPTEHPQATLVARASTAPPADTP